MAFFILLSVTKIFVTGLTILFFALYIYFKKQYNYWKSKSVPCAKPLFPIGNLTGMINVSFFNMFKKIYDESKHNRYYGIWLFHKPALLINDPDLIQRILVQNFIHFHSNGSSLGNGNDPLFKDSLFSLDGSKWKNLRSKITPIFSPGKLKANFSLIAKCGQDLQYVLEEYVRTNDIMDVKEFSDRFMTDATASTAFGIEINHMKNPDSEISKMMKKVFEPGVIFKFKFVLAVFMSHLAQKLKLSLTSKELQDFFVKMFRDLVDFRQKNNFWRNDAMQLLIELLKKGYIEDANRSKEEVDMNKQKFTFENLTTQAMTFLVGGHKTTSLTIQFALFELAVNQEIQRKLRNEITTVLSRHNGEVTYEAVDEMKYLGRVVNETLRKYPPPGVPRLCTKKFKDPCSDLTIDKDTIIIIPICGLHYDERYYPNPEKFDPDRFTTENKSARPKYTFLPFGEGPRICIGQRLAILETKVVMIAIMSKFQLEPPVEFLSTSMEFHPLSFLTAPKDQIKLRISFAE